ncbi:MFS general substrate transporter [Apiospora saccharicola]|uniref:MFS general substrate transporter n=1 Tax=Apiospora saccharicola TaxID=335842 RepID=A0ABR1TIS8_9PEZI
MTDQSMLQPAASAEGDPYTIFDRRQKRLIVFIVSVAGTSLPALASDFGVSVDLINLTVTAYLVFQGLAPSLWGPVSDVLGRRIAYLFTFIVFLGACIGLAETPNYPALVILRCLQSAGSASTIAIGSGVVGDITTRADRGSYMGVFQAGLLLPVVIGPIIGGALAGSSLRWRSIFWALAIYGGCFLIVMLLLLPETLRTMVGNGSRTPSKLFAKYPLVFYQKAFPDFGQQTCGPLAVFLAVYYAVWQMSITAMSSLFEARYGLSETQVGLTFIANGLGAMVGTLITGKILDRDYCKVKAVHEAQESISEEAGQSATGTAEDAFPIEKARLRLVPVFSTVQCLSILLFGWCIQFPEKVPIAVPIVSTFITGWTLVSTQSVIITYIVDVFPDRSAAASASLNLARCLLAAGGTGFVMPMINGIDVGFAFTVCASVQLLALSLVFVTWKFAGKWRQEAALGKSHEA